MSETHLQRHVARVEQWGEDRGLYDTDSPMVQFGKMVEEVGELIMAIGKDDVEGIKDAIGDIRVCLIGVCKIAVCDPSVVPGWISSDWNVMDVLFWASATGQRIYGGEQIHRTISRINGALLATAVRHGFTLEECDDHAWEQIKDRKGKTVNGEFIKEQI